MRKIKDIVRLKLDDRRSHRQIAAALGIFKGVFTKYAGLAAAAGMDWTSVQGMDEVTRERRLMAAPERPCDHVQPDYGSLHQELRRKGMTLMPLWEEHRANHADRKTHGYTGLCENYRRFGPCQYCHVHDILKNNRDQSAPATAHVRGQGYYQRGTTR